MNDIPDCDFCGAHFEDIFEAVDHLDEDDDYFDPKMKLPGGYSIMIGSLLRDFFDSAEDTKKVKQLAEWTFAILYAAVNNESAMHDLVEEAVVREHMSKFEEQLENLLEGTDG